MYLIDLRGLRNRKLWEGPGPVEGYSQAIPEEIGWGPSDNRVPEIRGLEPDQWLLAMNVCWQSCLDPLPPVPLRRKGEVLERRERWRSKAARLSSSVLLYSCFCLFTWYVVFWFDFWFSFWGCCRGEGEIWGNWEVSRSFFKHDTTFSKNQWKKSCLKRETRISLVNL